MQVACRTKTGWNMDQRINKHFESNGKITTDKNEARISSSLFLLHDARDFVKIEPCLHVLRPAF